MVHNPNSSNSDVCDDTDCRKELTNTRILLCSKGKMRLDKILIM